MAMTSTLSSKGQVTIPKRVREALGLRAGDAVEYVLADAEVLLRRLSPVDRAFHEALSATLDEWTRPEDEEAFADL